ncbi:MAG: flagellar biosynthesis protein FlhB [Bdellovibrionales bacterium]
MAEGEDSTDDSQKTEEPTARKLEEARKKGQVIYSREVSTWMMLFAATILILGGGPALMNSLTAMFKSLLAGIAHIPADGGGLQTTITDIFASLSWQVMLPLFALAIIGILSGLVQTGLIFSAAPISPDLSKISPLKGLMRLFSARSIVEFIKGIVKIVVISAAIAVVTMPYFDSIDHFIDQPIIEALVDFKNIFLKMMIATLAILFVLAIADYLYQRHEFMKKMRMSKQEIKDEFKQTEGDPAVKGRLREIRAQKARQRMMQAVPTSDVVITNPTHYAVALKYDTKEMAAPQMVAKGTDMIAQRIKDIAKENDVPIIENPALARALFDGMDVEQTIPFEHFKAVAEVISYVFKLKGKKI